MSIKSGTYWVTWADLNAKNSRLIQDLEPTFQRNVKAFIAALTDAGASVTINTTKRHAKRAYLFHWAWKISQQKCQPSEATPLAGVDIQWDHGDLHKSITGAYEMVRGFGLAIPPASTNPPSLTSNHIQAQAIDMIIKWQGNITVKNKDGTESTLNYTPQVNSHRALHAVGNSFGVKKLTTDAPHWSHNGR